MNYVTVEHIAKSFGERVLFEDLSFGINKEQKIAFVAKNGTGKTTLLNIMSRREEADSGAVTFRNDLRTAFLDQNPKLDPEQTVSEAIFDSTNPLVQAIQEYENCLANSADEVRMQAALDKMDELKAWDFEVLMKQVLTRLKLDQLTQPIGVLSGGQRKRVALARVLLDEPDFLILDEPTNHLDTEMIEWLESYLANQKLTLFMVTHDRYFLETVCNEIMELDQGQIYRYRGNYSYYLEKKSEREAVTLAEVDKAQNLMRKELEWIRRQPKARGTKSKARVDAFGDLKNKASQRISTDKVELEINIGRLGGKILELHSLKKSYGSLPIINHFDYKFVRGEKVGITGPNGVGKSTLLNMIMGLEEPDGGKVVQGETVQFGYYAQEGLDVKDGMRVIEAVREVAEVIPLTKGRKITAAQLLERFLFPRSSHYQQVSKLSGGEKRRLFLLRILMRNPNFLILDEPTNDLDILTLNVLEDFLEDFPGCLLIVSHDRYFMDKLVDHLLVFEGDGEIRDFPGNYTQFRAWKKQQKADESKAKEPEKAKTKAAAPKVKTKLSYNEKVEFEKLTKEIDQLESRKAELSEALSSGTLDNDTVMAHSEELSTIATALEEKENRWLELSEWA